VELTDYLTTLRRRWKLVVAFVLVFVAVGMGLTAAATPQYAATAQIFVSTTPTDTSAAYQGSLFATQRVASYADLIGSRPLAETVSRKLGGSPDPATLMREVGASVVANEVILTITATDPSPALARQIANAYAQALSRLVHQLETPENTSAATAPFVRTSIVDTPALPTSPVSPRPLLNIAIALILGLLAGVAAAVLRQRLDRTITSQGDVKDITPAPILGHIQLDTTAIRKAPTAALRETTGWAEAFRVLRTNMQYVEVDRDQKVFVISSSLQGEGKSTTAVNLAVTLAMAEARVVLVECDLRRPTIAGKLGLDEAVGTTTVLVGIRNLDEREKIAVRDSGVHVFTMKDIDRQGIASIVEQAMKLAGEGTAGVHVSFDIDVCDPSIAPGVGTPVKGGLNYREAHMVMEIVADSGRLTSLDLVEVNPTLDVRNTTAQLGAELALSALGMKIL